MRRLAAAAAALVLAACGGGGPAEWSAVEPNLGVPGETADPIPVDRVLPAGRYWGVAHEVLGSDDVVFVLSKARFGAACEAWAAGNGRPEGCPNDYAVDDTTTQVFAVDDLDWVTVADAAGPGSSRRVRWSTLEDLVRGEKVETPSGYSWAAFPFLVTIDDGRAVAVDQYWVP